MRQERDVPPNEPPRSPRRCMLALSAYVLAVVVTLVSVVDFPLVISVSLFLYDHGLGFLGRWVVFGTYVLEFVVFLIFRRVRIGNRYLSLVMTCLAGMAVVTLLVAAFWLFPAMSNMAPM